MRLLFNGVSVWKDEKVLKMNGGLHNIVNILDATILYFPRPSICLLGIRSSQGQLY